mgnify:CR=1 FL=1
MKLVEWMGSLFVDGLDGIEGGEGFMLEDDVGLCLGWGK